MLNVKYNKNMIYYLYENCNLYENIKERYIVYEFLKTLTSKVYNIKDCLFLLKMIQ